ncbi:MAG TPA: hypothetical protein DEG32_06330, partial [Balneolaceae bacterium]|nr:hypothetical protein [Balneolaceae bacterium]
MFVNKLLGLQFVLLLAINIPLFGQEMVFPDQDISECEFLKELSEKKPDIILPKKCITEKKSSANNANFLTKNIQHPFSASGDEHWISESYAPGVDGNVRALEAYGDDIYVGGSFFYADTIEANSIVRFNKTDKTWEALGEGIWRTNGNYGSIDDMLIYNEKLYVAGSFDRAGEKNATSIAYYDFNKSEWFPLKGYPVGIVRSIDTWNNQLIIGGQFTEIQTDDSIISASNIVIYDLEQETWSTLGNGLEGGYGVIWDSEVINDTLYVGGNFINAGESGAEKLAQYSLVEKEWNAISENITGNVVSLEKYNGKLIVAGNQLSISGSDEPDHIAVYDPIQKSWAALRLGDFGTTSIGDDSIWELTVSDNMLYFGGNFGVYDYEFHDRVGIYNLETDEFSRLEGVSRWGSVLDIVATENDLFVANALNSPGTPPAKGLLHYRFDSGWQKVSSAKGFNGHIEHIVTNDQFVIVSGEFTSVGGGATGPIAKFSLHDESWGPLNTILTNTDIWEPPRVFELGLISDSLFVAGVVAVEDDIDKKRFLMYDLKNNIWEQISLYSDRPIINLKITESSIYASHNNSWQNSLELVEYNLDNLQIDKVYNIPNEGNLGITDSYLKDGKIYFGGWNFGNDQGIFGFDLLNEEKFYLGSGIPGNAFAIDGTGNKLFVAGQFSAAGGIEANSIAQYDIDTEKWTSLGSGLGGGPFAGGTADAQVWDIKLVDDHVFVGGYFAYAGGKPANYIARYNVNSDLWSNLGSGVRGGSLDVQSMEIVENRLFVGGLFTIAGNKPASRFAIWDGLEELRQPPSEVSLISPQNNIQDVAVDAQFDWEAGDLDKNYRFQLSLDEDFNQLIVDTLLADNIF